MVITEDLNSEIDGQTPMLEKLGAKLFARGKRAISGFQFDMNLLRPTSHGNVTLASPDARDQPHIDFNYLADCGEMAIAVAAVKEARRIASQPALQAINGGEISPGKHVCSDTELLDAIKLVANTGQHPVSTCRMGVDPGAGDVVDGHCRVFGVGRLRIVDASIFPRQICGNPTAPIMAMAEKAADLILGRTSA